MCETHIKMFLTDWMRIFLTSEIALQSDLQYKNYNFLFYKNNVSTLAVHDIVYLSSHAQRL